MKNNKGFSLVELIIVIAIMAILVGVMAPQLIKYIEKSNVSSDTQLCDSVRTAITTAMMDPAVINDPAYSAPASGVHTLATLVVSGTVFGDAVLDTLGAADADAVNSQLKSTTHNNAKANTVGISVEIVNSNNVIVYVPGGCGNGEKDNCGGGTPDCGGLYAGATQPTTP